MNIDPYPDLAALQKSYSNGTNTDLAYHFFGSPSKRTRRRVQHPARHPAPKPPQQSPWQPVTSFQEVMLMIGMTGTLDDVLRLAGFRDDEPSPKISSPANTGKQKSSRARNP
jgi:hypothetical protein